MFKLVRFIFIFLLFVPLAAFDAEARKMIASYNYLPAYVDDNYKCQNTVQIYIKSMNRSTFLSRMRDVSMVASQARMNLMKKCPDIKKILVSGIVKGEEVYAGYMSPDTRWGLKKDMSRSKAVIRLNIPRTKTPGKPYINQHNELVVYDSGPFTVSSPLNRSARLRSGTPVKTVNEWCDLSLLPFLFEFDGGWEHRNSYFESGFENFFMDKIFPTIQSLYSKNGNTYEYKDYMFSMRNRNERVNFDSFHLAVWFKPGTHDIKSIKKSYFLYTAKDKLPANERTELFNQMSRSHLINVSKDKIYEDEFITIYPHQNKGDIDQKIGRTGWCDKAELNIVYKMSLKEREKKITFEYLSPIVFNILKQHCDIPSVAQLYFYPANEDKYWDTTMYRYCRLAGMNDICAPENTKFEFGIESEWTDGPLKIAAQAKEFRECDTGIGDYNDVIEAFAQGNFCLLKHYRGFVRLFHNDFVTRYSVKCRKQIKNPVRMSIKLIETESDEYGYVNSRRQVGPGDEVYMDKRFSDRFDDFMGPNQAYRINQGFKRAIKKKSLLGLASGMLNDFSSLRIQIDKFLSTHCASEKGKLVYENIDNFYQNKPPLTLDDIKSLSLKKKSGQNTSAPKPQISSQKKNSKPRTPLPDNSSQKSSTPIRSTPKFAGSWKGVIEEQAVEIVLWPSPNSGNFFYGVAYVPQYDCLLWANIRKGPSLYQLSLIKNAITRNNNCMLNTGDLNGRYKKAFQAGGYVSIDKHSGILKFAATNLYLCRKIVDGEKDINFKRSPISSKMLELINSDGIINVNVKLDTKLLPEVKQ